VATVTGIGGGTVRDLLLGSLPVYWVQLPSYAALCLVVAAIVFFAAPLLQSRARVLLWADALGIALFSVTGAERTLQVGAPVLIAVLMGVITATFGGIIRDVVCNELPLILRKEIYATAAAAGALVCALLVTAGASAAVAETAGFAVAFAARAVGLAFGLSLPTAPSFSTTNRASRTCPEQQASFQR
jgi:uncharacterized membrane protein YeiH